MLNEVPYHLVVFQSCAAQVRTDPQGAIDRLSEWLSDKDSPRFWAPFAYSIRGLAYENLSDWKMAKHDYAAGMQIYNELEEQYGKEKIGRLENNARFMLARKSSLPMEPPTPRIESKQKIEYILVEGPAPGGRACMGCGDVHCVKAE